MPADLFYPDAPENNGCSPSGGAQVRPLRKAAPSENGNVLHPDPCNCIWKKHFQWEERRLLYTVYEYPVPRYPGVNFHRSVPGSRPDVSRRTMQDHTQDGGNKDHSLLPAGKLSSALLYRYIRLNEAPCGEQVQKQGYMGENRSAIWKWRFCTAVYKPHILHLHNILCMHLSRHQDSLHRCVQAVGLFQSWAG